MEEINPSYQEILGDEAEMALCEDCYEEVTVSPGSICKHCGGVVCNNHYENHIEKCSGAGWHLKYGNLK